MNTTRRRFTASLLATPIAVSAFAQQDYPARPVKIVVGYAPGGSPDLIARTIGKKLSDILGQPFVVENRAGAGGTTAVAQVARAPADGYTLMLGETGQLAVSPFIYKSLPYDTMRDLVPIGLVASTALIVVTTPATGIRSMADLVREAKGKPGQLAYGHSGVGTTTHLLMETLKSLAGIDLISVPYKGSGQSITAVLAGDVPLLALGVQAAAPHIAAGKLLGLGVSTTRRVPSLQNVPPVSDTIKDFDYATDMGLLAPVNLPAPVLAKLSSALRQASAAPELLGYFNDNNMTLRFTTPSEYGELIRKDLRLYERAVRIANIPAE